jgi:hypothetical protein
MDAHDWRDLAMVLEAGERSARHKDPALATALDSMARQCRRLACREETPDPELEADDPGRPDRCHHCGGPAEDLGFDPVDGWYCPNCGASDADETG